MSDRGLFRRPPVVGLLVAVILAATAGACGGSSSAPVPAKEVQGVTCSNFAIHANGSSDDEVSVRVKVHNSTTRTAIYTIDVEMTAGKPAAGDGSSKVVAVEGSVASRASAELGHKVLVSNPVTHCRVAGVTRS